jgi:hypothetical protein
MRVSSNEKLPVYQVIGLKLRIHWDYQEVPATEDMPASWSCEEAVVFVKASRSEIIEAIIAVSYPTPGSELAAIINGGEDAASHEASRVQAKALADGWFAVINATPDEVKDFDELSGLGSVDKDEMEANLAARIEEQKAPKTETGVPWSN